MRGSVSWYKSNSYKLTLVTIWELHRYVGVLMRKTEDAHYWRRRSATVGLAQERSYCRVTQERSYCGATPQ